MATIALIGAHYGRHLEAGVLENGGMSPSYPGVILDEQDVHASMRSAISASSGCAYR